MVLADTSAWLRNLYGISPFQDLGRLLRNGQVVGHQLVYGELLIGDSGGGRRFLTGYNDMRQAPLVPHAEVVTFVNSHRLHGLGLSWIDVHLLASALVGHHQLWTADAALASVSGKLGIAY